jgi:hypothetical protein
MKCKRSLFGILSESAMNRNEQHVRDDLQKKSTFYLAYSVEAVLRIVNHLPCNTDPKNTRVCQKVSEINFLINNK